MTFLVNFVELLCNVLTIAIIFRVILSWFSPRPTNRLAIVLIQITEPFLRPLRRIIPRTGILDFTPLAAIILLQLIKEMIVRLLT